MKRNRVVVTGIGALTALGNDAATFKRKLFEGVSGAVPITKFDASKFKTRFACEVNGFDPAHFGMDRKEVRKMDLFSQYAVATSVQAVSDAGLDFSSVDRNRAGVIWGSGIGGLQTFYQEVVAFAEGDGTPRFNPFFIPKMIIDLAAGHISIRFGLQGANYATVSACASSSNAIAEATRYIQSGLCDMMITGGSEAVVTVPAVGGFNAMKALSTRNEAPAHASRPFDHDRDGFVLGEGSGALILESLEHAQARGAKIYAEVLGSGLSADAHHITAPEPEGKGASTGMLNALKDAGIGPEMVDYINVHATSTPLGDVAELKSIGHVFGNHAYKLSISSTKSMTGHLLGAAGAVEALACLFALEDNRIPPTINHQTPDPKIDPHLNLTFNHAQERAVSVAMSNTFGFGGHNVSILFGKYHS